MNATGESGEQREAPRIRRTFLERWFNVLLVFVVVLSLVPRVILGTTQFISYDGFWHLFIAKMDNWTVMWDEVRANAHPPLFYLILHLVVRLGTSTLLYRAPVILPGIAATYIIGHTAAKICRSKVVALLAAAAYGTALSMIDVTIDVRSYSLAIFFSVLAFDSYIDFIRDPHEPRSSQARLLFAIFMSLAITSEYYAVFFLAACVSVPALFALRYSDYRRQLIEGIVRYPIASASAFVIMLVTLSTLYQVHLRFQPASFVHIGQYYWNANEWGTMWKFISTNLVREWNLFMPIEMFTIRMTISLSIGILILILYFSFFRRFSPERISASAPGLALILLLGELIFLAIRKRYPFGGELRQQSILFPLIVLTGFVLVDRGLSRFKDRQRFAVLAVIAVLIARNFNSGWRAYPRMTQDEFVATARDTFLATVPHPQAVYVDGFSLIFYFMYANAWHWAFERHLGSAGLVDGVAVDEYRTTNSSGAQVELLRNKGSWNFDLNDPATYKVLGDSLRAANIGTVVLYSLRQSEDPMGPAGERDLQKEINLLANAADLEVGRTRVDSKAAFIELILTKKSTALQR